MGPLCKPSTDLFDESEHRSFLKQLFSFLEYYRRKIEDLATYTPIGKIIISCFNWLCSFFIKFQKLGAPIPHPIEEIPLDSLKYSGEKGKVEKEMKQKMVEKRKSLEKKLMEFREEAEDYDREFHKNKEEFEKRIQEIEEKEKKEKEEKDRIRSETSKKNFEKAVNDLKKSHEEFENEFQKKKLESERKWKEYEEKMRREQEEKDRIANSETERLIRETRHQFEEFIATRGRRPNSAQEASEQLNSSLTNYFNFSDIEKKKKRNLN